MTDYQAQKKFSVQCSVQLFPRPGLPICYVKMDALIDTLESDPTTDLCDVQESLLERYADEPEILAKFAGERADFIMAALENFASGGEDNFRVERRSAGYSQRNG